MQVPITHGGNLSEMLSAPTVEEHEAKKREFQKPLYAPLLDNGNGSVKANFMVCFVEAFRGREIRLTRASDSLAQRGMNKIANDFLRSECDFWINIDADILFTRRDIDNLLSHPEKLLVYGLYPKKQEDCPPCIGTFADVPIPGSDNLAIVRRCGRGFMLVHRALLVMMKEENGGPAIAYHNHGETEWDFFPAGVVTGEMSSLADGAAEFISEDWFFCERARSLGVPTLVDVRIALGHEGAKVYRFGPDQCVRTDWQSVPGWFSEADAECYRRIAAEVPNGGRIAEIGCWMGRSMAALATFLVEQNKVCELHAIDTFKGTPGDGDQCAVAETHGGSVRKVFESNLLAFGCRPKIHEMESREAPEGFDHRSLHAVFIDGAHDYKSVLRDILWWEPIVKYGGIIAGHDYDNEEVGRAVAEACRRLHITGVERIGNCWLLNL